MLTLKQLIKPFLMPPGIFITLLVFSGTWFFIKKYHRAGIVNCLIGMSIWLFSILPFSNAVFSGLESNFSIPEKPKGDVIILLSYGAYENVPDLSGTGAPEPGMYGRLVTAVRIQKTLNIPVIASGTGGQIVKRFLNDLGVPLNMIIMEERSRDTISNARYSKEICEKYGLKMPLLVTSAYHMKRAVLSFKKARMDVTSIPADFKTSKNIKYCWENYLPSTSSLEMTSLAIHEYLGLLFYRMVY